MKKTAEFFSHYAQGFNNHYNEPNLIDKLFRKSMYMRFEKALKVCQPIEGKKILDVGCGTGIYDFELAKRGANFILGVDFADGMIKFAQEKSRQLGLEDKCNFVRADFFSPPLPNEQIFDYAIATGVMDYIENQKEFIDNVLKVTKTTAFFSFPKDGGLLALQRKIRYKLKCPLFLYTNNQVNNLFKDIKGTSVIIEDIGREILVTVNKQ
ncbi:MAG: class I SAM-dependent methyltransferase [Candidatus Roizmanbacteria bacterium]